MGQLDGKVAVVTGGASGIGAGTCRLFVEQGARVVVCDLLDAEGEKLMAQLGRAALYIHTDVTREADVAAALWLASDAASFVNGHALVVDGGLTAGRGWSETLAAFDGLRERLGAPPREQS